MPWGRWISELPTAFFLVAPVAAVALGSMDDEVIVR
jgi:hypothetical protein